ncbi:hypothetical protein NZK33_00010 [Cyanobium sp. FGCU-6]|nr:hypothetical protein [Cyanobium sp. FGCU6]
MKSFAIARPVAYVFSVLAKQFLLASGQAMNLRPRSHFARALHRLKFRVRAIPFAPSASLMLLGLAGASVQPAAAAQNLQNFNLQWNSYSSPLQISGVITLDLDLLDPALPAISPLPYSTTPPSMPAWVHALSITVPGSGAGTGTFDLSDYIGLEWQNNNGLIDFDFSTELIGQGGWGTTCDIFPDPAGYCNFLLITDPSTTDAPFGDVGFQMYTLNGGGQYGGLVTFTPAGPPSPTSSVPGPLPLAGAAALLHSSRRLRRRVIASATSNHQITT